MRMLSLFAAGFTLLSLPAMAEAPSRETLYIETRPRSWLDPGKVSQPGGSHGYVYDIQASSQPTGSRAFSNRATERFPRRALPVDYPAPEFLRR